MVPGYRRLLRASDPCCLIHQASDVWTNLLTAVALMLVIEGLLPFVNPTAWRRMFEQALRLSDGQVRFLAMSSMVAGVVLLYFLA